ncbi:uncharacterized protein LOC128743113 [Sabethes cyaneus]|uniref:uncharacterized protein LOC128739316 n=1 Tax=Sabethes cyaneus TaxID=53552 RepID=UPI00237E2B57|nr:uncharacterized protein LOC128739316 [Sabethes cyaneus]XP_053690870.1 uncharacterized protein LOC128739316 [Sabethes cyaneus]XP_053695611.1 uncharacterized protein LOC128743113 [Sabethes cyaneus]
MANSKSGSCLLCSEVDTNEMVQCDQCDGWAHYGCAGVNDTVKDHPWSCPKCSNFLQVPKKKGAAVATSKKTSTDGKKTSSKGETGSVSSAVLTIEESLRKMQEEMDAKEKALENERILRRKRLEMERAMKEKELSLERELRQMELDQERELRADQLKQEQELLNQRLKEEEEFLKRRNKLREQFKNAKKVLVENYGGTGREKEEDQKEDGDEEGAVGGIPDEEEEEDFHRKVEDWLDNQKLQQKPVVSGAKATKGPLPPPTLPKNPSANRHDIPNNEDPFERLTRDERNLLEGLLDRTRNVSRPEPVGLSQAQISARQSISKQLPVFRGEAELWPIFISSYEYTTEACGFSNLDNLKRLQDSLKGDALEAVRSRLVLPDSVPDVIRDLRNLFGRPEKLLKTLLMKVRQAKSPRADRLETFIHFGITVKQLCDHLEAAKLVDHLSNPMLVQELVDKLPPNYKLDWVRYKRNQVGTPLRIFTEFMNGIVSDVSEVSEFSTHDLHDHSERSARAKQNKKEFVHVHNSFPGKRETTPNVKSEKPCWVCKRTDHKIRFCDDFRKLNIAERLKLVERFKLCELCLNNHGKSRCNFKIRCNVANCQGGHNPLLHRSEEIVQIMEVQCNAHNRLNRSVLFRMLPVTLHVGNRGLDILAFLDEGSSITLVEDSIANKLKINGTAEPLVVTWTGNMKRFENGSRKVDLMVSARGSTEQFPLREARTVAELILPKQEMQFREIAARYPHLQGLPVEDYDAEEPKMMIGLDNMHVFAPLESRVGRPGEPIGVRSQLGWTVYGQENQCSLSSAVVNFHAVEPVSNQALHDMIRSQYVMEEAGVTPAGIPESAENERAREILQSTTVRVGCRFETGLLWRDDERKFPDSYPMAVRRMQALERKLLKNEALRQNVEKQITDYQLKGYAHIATPAELVDTDPAAVWYLPLNVVTNPKKPGKVRLVWDAAATVNGVSLNTELLKGPDMLTSLPAVIQRFRERSVGFGGDIQEMYHQIRIRAEDKQAQRFLYRPSSNDKPQVFVMDVATFGSTCSPCSAQFIKNLNAEEHAEQYPEAAVAIVKNHYVDDYFDSLDTAEEAIRRAQEVKAIHSRGGFNIRNWVSNSSEFLREMGEQRDSSAVRFHQDKQAETERVLGIVWDSEEDEFSFSTITNAGFQLKISGEVRPTKRNVLSCVMAMFDPLGLLAPFTISGKMLIQDLWRTGCEWDEQIDDESMEKWMRWVELLPTIAEIRIPRSYFGKAHSQQVKDLQLHIFTDAGEKAYGCVGYFRAIVNEEIVCVLVMSRTKVAPLKQLSIPRLELQAAVLGARLVRTVQESHSYKIQQTFLWTDSRTVLSWIRSDQRRYKPFVGFRIGEILSRTNLSDWRWTPTKLNEADRLTKWRRDAELESNSSWFKGPSFLYQDEANWPQQTAPANTKEELRAQFLFHDVVVQDTLVDVHRFSKWNVLVRTVACVCRFGSNCRRRMKGDPIETLKATKNQAKSLRSVKWSAVRTPLKQEEFQQAERYLLRAVQAEAFGDELKTLMKNRNRPTSEWIVLEKSSPLYKLTPLVDENDVIRMEGRTEKAEFLPFDLRFPVILPRDHHVTELIVQHYHERFGHGYRETVKNEIRQRFYIPKVGTVVYKVSKACQWCKVHHSRPRVPRMAALPVQRLQPYRRPFSFTGIDYLGPVNVTVARHSEKRWIAVFTCFVTRAVHLEVSASLTTQSCLMAIRRFIHRRGPPQEFFSDNGTNLKGASKELTGMINDINSGCADELTDARMQWSFNPPAAPHMGGVWERLVRSVKEALEALNDGKRLTDEILHTSVTAAEDMINSRPLVYVSQETVEAEALSPNHFLRGVSPNEPQMVPPPPHPAEVLRDAYKRSQELAQEMWGRWIKEYVPSLNQRSKWHGEARVLKKGDLVYVVEGSKRRSWVRGRIEEVIPASDGRVRQALVRTSSGLFRRAVAQLAVIEVGEEDGGKARPEVASGLGLRAGEMLGALH